MISQSHFLFNVSINFHDPRIAMNAKRETPFQRPLSHLVYLHQNTTRQTSFHPPQQDTSSTLPSALPYQSFHFPVPSPISKFQKTRISHHSSAALPHLQTPQQFTLTSTPTSSSPSPLQARIHLPLVPHQSS